MKCKDCGWVAPSWERLSQHVQIEHGRRLGRRLGAGNGPVITVGRVKPVPRQ